MRNVTVAEWTAALRSGKYEQGQEALCKDGRYCCLGVLADLAEVPRQDEQDPVYKDVFLFTLGDGKVLKDANIIPGPFVATIVDGLNLGRTHDGKTLSNRTRPEDATIAELLMDANDNGKSFSEIADMIEGFAASQAAARGDQA